MEQNMIDLAADIAQHTKESVFQNPITIADILHLLSLQKPEYSGFEFKRKGTFALVLKAEKSNYKTPVELKIREVDKMENIQREQDLRRNFRFYKNIAQVRQSFYLTRTTNSDTEQVYLVEEMELSDGNLEQYLLEFKKNKKLIDDDIKIFIVIQMLDIMNTLHKKNVVHRDVNPQIFLIFNKDSSQPTIQLCDLTFSVQLHFEFKHIYFPTEGIIEYQPFEAIYDKYYYKSDLYSLGIVILEIDNTKFFDFASINTNDLLYLLRGFPPKDSNFNENSELYKLTCKLLSPFSSKRPTAEETLQNLLKSLSDFKFPCLFSIITTQQLFNQPFYPLKSSAQSIDRWDKIQVEIDQLIPQPTKGELFPPFKQEQIKQIIFFLISECDFKFIKYLGMGSAGIVFEVDNIKEKRNAALKICLCQNDKERAKKRAEFALRRQCQMPNIVKFYGYQFLNDANKNKFVIEEYEKCQENLGSFLKNLNPNRLSDDQKSSMSLQILESVLYLHKLNILHGDIKPDNILVSYTEGDYSLKLTDFDQSAPLEEDWLEENEITDLTGYEILPPYNCLINGQTESHLFNAPERNQKQSQTTKQTDIFAVGLCLALLDNNLTFTEYELFRSNGIFRENEDIPFEKCKEKINKNNTLYPLIEGLVQYSPFKRSSIESAIFKIRKNTCNNSRTKILPFNITSINLPILNLNLRENNLGNADSKSLAEAFGKLPNLSILNLNLRENNLDKTVFETLAEGFGKLSNLLSLSLDLQLNNLSSAEAKLISNGLKKMSNLTNLDLNFGKNNLGPLGAEVISTGLKALTNLASLKLGLGFNNLNTKGTEFIANALTKLIDLSSLNLNLESNNVSDNGLQSLLKGLHNIINISSLSVNLSSNSLSISGVESFQELLGILINLSKLNLNLSSNCLSFVDARQSEKSSLDPSNLLNINSENYPSSSNASRIELVQKTSKTEINPLRQHSDVCSSTVRTEFFQKLFRNQINIQSLNLNLSNSKLTDENVDSLSKALITLKNLSNLCLNLENNNLSGDIAESLLSAFNSLPDLQNLNLNLMSNTLRTNNSLSPMKIFKQLTNLTSLNLNCGYCKLTEFDIKQLSLSLLQLTNLQSLILDLVSVNLDHTQTKSLSISLTNLTNLSSLNLILQSNNLSFDDTQSLCKALESLKKLSSLNLAIRQNQFHDTNAKSLANVLLRLPNLANLNLDFRQSNLRDYGVKSLKELTKLINLKCFSLHL